MPTINFKGKTFVQNHHLAVKHHQLIPQPDKSLTDKVSLHDNLIIQGDNLIALKALLPTYAGKIKCIYIDPPYNTGKESWVYNDNVKSPMIQEWLGKVVDREDLTRHDKWLCMMFPRLKLLRELLSDQGVIFISIDDNELYRLTVLLYEILNENDWVGTIVWRNVTDNNPSNIAIEHEYIVCFAKNKEAVDSVWKSKISDAKDKLIEIGDQFNRLYHDQVTLQNKYSKWFRENKSFLGPLDRYKYIDSGGVYTGSQSVHNPGKEGYRYNIIHPETGTPCKEPLMGYRFPETTMEEMLRAGKILFGKDETKIIELKLYAAEYADKLPSVIELDGRLGSYDLKELFPEVVKAFDNPKPVQLITQLLSYVTSNDDLILDSFAGSGTTAHAVLDLNEEDSGSRKFILIEQDEYADSVTAERVRRVITRNEAEKERKAEEEKGRAPLFEHEKESTTPSAEAAATPPVQEGSFRKPTFSYFTVGEPIEMESILHGEALPTFTEFARYLFYTATGEEFDASLIDEKTGYIGESRNYEVYLFYRPDLAWLKSNALTLNTIRELPKGKGKQRLVFAPAKYVSDEDCRENKVDFSQLPFEIYRLEK